MSHAARLTNLGLVYLSSLELNDLYQLKNELDDLWSKGQSTIANHVYDKIVDSINYEMTRLNDDPYTYAMRRSDVELKKLFDYFNQVYAQGKPLIDNSVWDVLNREVSLRDAQQTSTSNIVCPLHWTTASLNELPVQLIPLSRSSKEFTDLCSYFSNSLKQRSTIVYSITRIQNLRLWSIFQQLQKNFPNTTRRLVHGTAAQAHQKLIVYHGFSHSFCPGGLIGDGVYFAVHASYSNNDPYVLRRTNHRRELFICQVVLGKSTQGHGGMTGAKLASLGCQSVYHHANENNNDMFCIFNAYQSYPEYIIQYDFE